MLFMRCALYKQRGVEKCKEMNASEFKNWKNGWL